MNGEQRLRASSRRLAARRPVGAVREPHHPGNPEPRNAFEVAVAEQLRYLHAEIERLNARFHWLMTVILGAAESIVIPPVDPLHGLRF